jgi:hypothetical protein
MNSQATRPLDRLLAELRALPERHNREEAVSRLRQIGTRVAAATRRMAQATVGRKCLSSVGAPFNHSADAATRRNAATAARDLATFIQAGKVGPASKKDETLLIGLVDSSDRVYRDIDTAWSSYFTGRIQGYRRLAMAAREAKLLGAEALHRSVEDLGTRTTALPSSDTDIGTISSLLGSVLERIGSLGLEGPPGEFLVAAVHGDATIAAMQIEEVRRFLDDHPRLVDMLRIKLT